MRLATQNDLTHVSFAAAPTAMSASELPFCTRLLSVPKPRAYRPDRIVRGLIGRWPLPVLNYTSGQMKRTLAQEQDRKSFDLIHLDSIHLAAYMPGLRRKTSAPVVIDWHNVESELMARFADNLRPSARKLYASRTANKLAAIEKQVLEQAAGHIACSERDAEQLRTMAPQARVAVIGNGVDVASFANNPAGVAERFRLVFVGSMDYHANVEAACLFARDSWPGIRKSFPGWRLTLVGSNPAAEVQALAEENSIEVTGTVPDVRPYYSEAFAAIVPLRTGGGTRLKILEAMAAGIPVLSTSLGAEGLDVSDGTNILICNSNENWQVSLASLAGDRELWDRMAHGGRALVQERYDWRILGDLLVRTYEQWFARAA